MVAPRVVQRSADSNVRGRRVGRGKSDRLLWAPFVTGVARSPHLGSPWPRPTQMDQDRTGSSLEITDLGQFFNGAENYSDLEDLSELAGLDSLALDSVLVSALEPASFFSDLSESLFFEPPLPPLA